MIFLVVNKTWSPLAVKLQYNKSFAKLKLQNTVLPIWFN